MRHLLLTLLFLNSALAQTNAPPLTQADLDPATFAQWVDGKETSLKTEAKNSGPAWILATTDSATGHSPQLFGDTNSPGPRHLRIGFLKKIPVGTVFARGGGNLSVLKPEAPYPGDLANPDHWTPAQRLNGENLPEPDDESYATWLLPPGTTTRALRFTHHAQLIETTYAGKLAGAQIHPERLLDLTQSATATSSANPKDAPKLLNGSHESWSAWSNRPKGDYPQTIPPSPKKIPKRSPSPGPWKSPSTASSSSSGTASAKSPSKFPPTNPASGKPSKPSPT